MTKVLGKGRGMVSLETWLPCRRPGQPRDPNIKPVNIVALLNTASKPKQTEENAENGPSQKGWFPSWLSSCYSSPAILYTTLLLTLLTGVLDPFDP